MVNTPDATSARPNRPSPRPDSHRDSAGAPGAGHRAILRRLDPSEDQLCKGWRMERASILTASAKTCYHLRLLAMTEFEGQQSPTLFKIPGSSRIGWAKVEHNGALATSPGLGSEFGVLVLLNARRQI